MPDLEKEESLERRRLQNRMAQRRFRERHSKKKNQDWNEYKLRDTSNQEFEVLEATTSGQPSSHEEHVPLTPFHAHPQSSALDFGVHINSDLDCDLFGDEELLHEMDLSGLDFPATIDTNETNQLSIMATSRHDSFMPSPVTASGPRHISLPLTPQTDTSTQSRSSATNSIMGQWPCSPASSTSQSMFTNPNTTNTTTTISESWHGPLHIAARNGNNRITQLLVPHVLDSNEKDSDGHTPLMLAVIGGHEDVVGTLLRHGARIADTDPEQRTALHLAVLHRRADLLHTLLAECPRDSDTVNAYDASGMTPLHLAIDLEFAPGVQSLLMVGADVASKARRR